VDQLRKRGLIVDVYVFPFNARSHRTVYSKNGTVKYYPRVGGFIPPVEICVLFRLARKIGEYDIIHAYQGLSGLGVLKELHPQAKMVATLCGEDEACINYRNLLTLKCTGCTSKRLLACTRQRMTWVKNKFIKAFLPGEVLFTYFYFQRSLAKKLDKFFAVSNTVKEIFVACGFRESKFVVTPEMIDPIFFEKLSHVKKERTNMKTVVLYVGRLAPEKGVDDLIKSFIRIDRANTELRIVGTGWQRKDLEALANNSTNNRIRFYGWVDQDELISLYKNADVFVHPGRWPEAFGRTILEAMLSRLAIIVADRGEPPRIIGTAGLVYTSPEQLEQQLELLIDNIALRTELGGKAYDRAISQYSPEAVVDRILSAYDELLDNSVAQRPRGNS
jgi:glycosyltransferase involved in cell wall biosynthesis